MGGVVWGGLVPHPPLIIPEIGQEDRKQVSETEKAMTQITQSLDRIHPDVLVIISPHGPVFYDGIPVWAIPELHGDFSRFGYPEVSFSTHVDMDMVRAIRTECEKKALPMVYLDESAVQRTGVGKKLDHGVMVPLHFLQQAELRIPLVMVAMGVVSRDQLFQMGDCIQRAAEKTGKNVAVMASGDLSHALSASAPAGLNPAGKRFDDTVKNIFQSGNLEGILEMDPKMVHQAAECGYNPLIILAGSMSGQHVETEVLSYEAPFGVGYLVAQTKTIRPGQNKIDLPDAEADPRAVTSPLVQWAKTCLETYVKEGKKAEIPDPVPEKMRKKAGVFVSIKKNGMLRGCIGTIFPVHDSIAEEICSNAISAGTADPRFYGVQADELPYLSYSVDVLTSPETVTDSGQLDPKKYGVIVRKGKRTGLLLPDLEGIDSVQDQLEIACRKAGIDPDSEYSMERFQVIRYE